jgi:uncharacterized membrane protein (UPF0136 family)
MKENILNLSNHLYLKLVAILCFLAIVIYAYDTPRVAPNGGTLLGYTLGTLGALIIIFLTLFGVRKRSYKSNLGDLKYWLSSHVWLGLSLIIIATLHTGFQFGINIHTLAYVLTMLVVLSGIWGVFMYMSYPSLMSQLLNGKTLLQQGQLLIEIDESASQLLEALPESSAFKVSAKKIIGAVASEPIIQSWRDKYHVDVSKTKTSLAAKELEVAFLNGESSARGLYLLMTKRLNQLKIIREFIRLKNLVSIWLLFHVPLSIGLLVCLTAHIFSVFFYW